MGTRKVELGKVGHLVRTEIRRRREQRQLSLQDLSERLEVLGRPILASGISKIESGDRRVDVDDLVVIADALGTVPSALLRGGLPRENAELTDEQNEAVRLAKDALYQCESLGVTRYEITEWMNAQDAWRRVMEQDPTGKDLLARIRLELQKGTPTSYSEATG